MPLRQQSRYKKIQESLVAPGQAMRLDMDVVLAIHNLIQESGKTVHFHHIEGHVEKSAQVRH